MIEKAILFLFISFFSSVAFLGCHVIAAFQVDETHFIDKPVILHKHPWIGSFAGFFSIIIFVSLFINGWFVLEWVGLLGLPIFWFVTNSTISSYFKYQKDKAYTIFRNPFYQLVFSGLLWFVLTVVNVTSVGA